MNALRKQLWSDKKNLKNLFGFFQPSLESSVPFGGTRHDFLPSMLRGDEEIFDKDHILLLTEIFEMSSGFVQSQHVVAMTAHVMLQSLVLFQLTHHGVDVLELGVKKWRVTTTFITGLPTLAYLFNVG